MKIKLVDGTEIKVTSVSKNYYNRDIYENMDGGVENEEKTTLNISVQDPEEKFEYYQNVFTDENIKKMEVLSNLGGLLDTLTASNVLSISYNIRDNAGSYLNIQLV